ncbi:hypothetical protein C492_08670 [Natronococcus jeotgali DSM 18795]|uniref:Uncharacterized protein n=1 Tax=Natronococcus jeotgali DSM 18795 TaxID=1227498 RepID=L9XKP3_9EURY|nr:hypothetical protein C492_08670 [Natronococcus jeotgali DSM 18795]
MSLDDRSARLSVVEGRDQPAIVASVPVLDLACARADRQGLGVVHAHTRDRNDSAPVLGHLAYKAAEREFLALVLSTDGDGATTAVAGTPEQPYPLLAEVALEAPAESARKFASIVRTGRYHQRDAPLTQAFFTADGSERDGAADARLFDRLLQGVTTPRPDATDEIEPGVTVLCIDPVHPRYSQGVRQVVERFIREHEGAAKPSMTVFEPQAVQDTVGMLISEGVEVEHRVWRDLFEFGTGILAPSFEGSEKGAGFGLNSLDQ